MAAALFIAGTSTPASKADSDTPACAGETISPEYRGTFRNTQVVEGKDPVVLLEMELKEKSVVITVAHGEKLNFVQEGWTCNTQGADILVLKFPKKPGEVQGYESRVLTLKNGDIIDLGETYFAEDIRLEERMQNDSDYRKSVYRRVEDSK